MPDESYLEQWKSKADYCPKCETYWAKHMHHVSDSIECLEAQDSYAVDFGEGEEGKFK